MQLLERTQRLRLTDAGDCRQVIAPNVLRQARPENPIARIPDLKRMPFVGSVPILIIMPDFNEMIRLEGLGMFTACYSSWWDLRTIVSLLRVCDVHSVLVVGVEDEGLLATVSHYGQVRHLDAATLGRCKSRREVVDAVAGLEEAVAGQENERAQLNFMGPSSDPIKIVRGNDPRASNCRAS